MCLHSSWPQRHLGYSVSKKGTASGTVLSAAQRVQAEILLSPKSDDFNSVPVPSRILVPLLYCQSRLQPGVACWSSSCLFRSVDTVTAKESAPWEARFLRLESGDVGSQRIRVRESTGPGDGHDQSHNFPNRMSFLTSGREHVNSEVGLPDQLVLKAFKLEPLLGPYRTTYTAQEVRESGLTSEMRHPRMRATIRKV